MPLPHLDSKKNSGPYLALLGGTIPLEGAPSMPLFLEGGSYTISGPGGKDVGPFTVNLTLPSPVVWTNRDQINAVDRSAGVTLTWSGGNASQLIIIAGGNLDQKTEAAGGFLCLVSAGDRTFAVPRSVLAGIPPTAPSQDPEDSLGGLALGTLLGDLPKFTASGLDAGYVVYGVLQAKTLTYR
jgi:hypothetical protein